jgi:hypothetical protein
VLVPGGGPCRHDRAPRARPCPSPCSTAPGNTHTVTHDATEPGRRPWPGQGRPEDVRGVGLARPEAHGRGMCASLPQAEGPTARVHAGGGLSRRPARQRQRSGEGVSRQWGRPCEVVGSAGIARGRGAADEPRGELATAAAEAGRHAGRQAVAQAHMQVGRQQTCRPTTWARRWGGPSRWSAECLLSGLVTSGPKRGRENAPVYVSSAVVL